jgi:predicted DNA-binding transcriptional regulator YafY
VTGFLARLHQAQAVIRLSPAGRRRLRELTGSAVIRAADETAAGADERGWVTAVVPIESVEHAHGEFFRLGSEMDVLSPPALRDLMRETARSLGQLYQAPAAG